MTQPQQSPDQRDDVPVPSRPASEAPLDERPAVAGGTDDGPPAQGEGAPDSW